MSGVVLWFTGLSGAGMSTVADLVGRELEADGRLVEYLDGDIVREHLSKGLGFSKEDRDTNIERIGWVASRLARHGATVLVSAISPYAGVREEVRRAVEAEGAGFVEVYVECPIDVLAERDVTGLYRKALAGEIKEFTGVSDPYEAPRAPEVVVRTDAETVETSAAGILFELETRGLVPLASAGERGGFSRERDGLAVAVP